jgi:hypothetical protein
MKKLIILWSLTISSFVWGQSNPQKECYEAANRQRTSGTTVSNHYDPKTQICWVRTQQAWQDQFGEYRGFYTIGNVYESQSKAMFLAPRFKELKSFDTCFVDSVKCHSEDEWFELAKKRYPDLF